MCAVCFITRTCHGDPLREAGHTGEVTTGGPSRAALVLAALAVVALGSVVGVRQALGTDCAVPDVRGLTEEAATADLADSGIDPAGVRVTRLADDSAEGTVLRQTDTTCTQPVRLVVSDGGPVVDVDELSAGLRDLFAAGPGDVPDVVRRVDTDAGPAYKSDATMVGDCPAVAAAADEVADHDYVPRCRTPPADTLRDAVAGALADWYADRGDPPEVTMTADDDATAWFGRSDLGGWRLFTAVTTDAGPEWVSAGLPRDEVRGGGYAFRRGDGAVQVVVYLVRPREATVRVPRPPIESEQLDDLAVSLLDVARTL
jgi:hypothetical protein